MNADKNGNEKLEQGQIGHKKFLNVSLGFCVCLRPSAFICG